MLSTNPIQLLKRLALSVIVYGLLIPTVWAEQQVEIVRLPVGELAVELIDNKGGRYPIGQLQLDQAGADGWAEYRLQLDHHRFTDHFLSMKEMKCIQGDELWCHVPYPYANPRRIHPQDLRWLEHELLFLFKRNGEFGANFWNGIYYRLELSDNRLRGEARALDLNLLASPPEELSRPPIGEFDLEEADLDKRWIPRIEIH